MKSDRPITSLAELKRVAWAVAVLEVSIAIFQVVIGQPFQAAPPLIAVFRPNKQIGHGG